MDKVQEHLVNCQHSLSNMERGGSTNNKAHADAATAAATKAKLERDATAKDLEEEAKHAMETMGHAFLKEKMESSKSSGFPDPNGARGASNITAATIASSSDSNARILPGPPTTLPQKVRYALFQLTGGGQQWYMRLTQDKAVTNWGYFARCIN